MAEYYVGRCRGCNAALAFRMAPGPGEMEESLSPSWASLILTREPTAKTEPCRCQEFAAAVRTVAPDATPEQVAEWVRVGQAVERLERSPYVEWSILRCEDGWEITADNSELSGPCCPTLPEAVTAALGDAP